MTKTNIFFRLLLICVGFFVINKGVAVAIGPYVEDTLTLMVISKWVMVFLVIGLAWRLKLFSEIGLTPGWSWKSLVLCWPIALIMLLSLGGGWNSNEVSLILLVAALALAASLTEETIFRGFFFHYLRNFSPVLIILVSSLAFGSMHLAGLFTDIPVDVVFAQVYFAAGFGAVLGNARARYAGLAVPFFVHAIFDFVTLGAKGGLQELLVYDSTITFGMLFAGTIMWVWAIWLLFIGKRRNSFRAIKPAS